MYKEITVNLDEDCIKLFGEAAGRQGMTLSAFLQDAGLLYLLRNDETSQKQLKALCRPERAHEKQRTARKKPRYSAGEEEQIFQDFAQYLNEALKQHRGEEFRCKYILSQENRVSWIDEAMTSGETAEENYAMEQVLHKKLMEALETGDEELCFEVVRTAMDWGGVYYSRGVRKGNKPQVEKLYREHELLNTLRRSYRYIQKRELELLEYSSSGWSIIWYLMDMEHLLIVSSRKVYALNKVLLAFREERGMEMLPASLDFGQLVYQGSPRYVEGVRYLYTQKAKLVLLKKCVRVLGAVKDCGDFTCNKELDNLLFIMGEA